MTGSLGLLGYDSFHFIVADLERSRRFYTEGLGFTEVARASAAKVEKGGEASSVFGAGPIRVLVSTPVRNESRAARWLRIHPDGISSLAFRVRDIAATWAFLEKRGGTFLSDVQTDEAGNGRFSTFSIATPLDDLTFRFIQREGPYPRFAPGFDPVGGGRFSTFSIATPLDDLTFRFIQREGPYPHFAPGFDPVGDGRPKTSPHGFSAIDHVTSNAYTMLPVVHWYRDVLGFTHYWDVEFHTADIDGGTRMTGSGLRSIVMADPGSGIKFATNEPMKPFFRDSQINRFCEDHHGAGVQHVAFHVKEILPAVEALRSKGIRFLPAPGLYYDRLPRRLEEVRITNLKEPMEALRKNHVLVDGADDKYMLQIFMQDAQAMYGDAKAGPFFYELIQREGDKGFGYGNFRALFESIEANQTGAQALEVVG